MYTHSDLLLHIRIYNQSYVDSNLDTYSQEPTHLNWQDCEFPSRARTWRAGGGAEEEEQTCSGPISSLLQFFIKNLSPVPWSSAAFPLHAASILYASTAHSCHSSPDKNKKGSYRHPFPHFSKTISSDHSHPLCFSQGSALCHFGSQIYWLD